MKKFEINKTYTSNFIGDHDLHGEYTVVARTEKSITLRDGNRTFKKQLDKYFLAQGEEVVKVGSGEFIHC